MQFLAMLHSSRRRAAAGSSSQHHPAKHTPLPPHTKHAPSPVAHPAPQANHECLYEEDIPEGLEYAHVQLVAKVLPPPEAITEVARIANSYWAAHPDKHIAIHCAYGARRCGAGRAGAAALRQPVGRLPRRGSCGGKPLGAWRWGDSLSASTGRSCVCVVVGWVGCGCVAVVGGARRLPMLFVACFEEVERVHEGPAEHATAPAYEVLPHGLNHMGC